MNVIIIDDEKHCRNLIRTILEERYPDITILAEADSIKSGLSVIAEHQPDLLFLDVELTDGTSFDLLNQITNISFQIIFVTAFDKYAVQAIMHSALDYILKPVDYKQMERAIQKSKSSSVNVNTLIKQIQLLESNKENFKKIALPTMTGLQFIRLSDILYCKSDKGYTTYFLKNLQKILTTRTLKDTERILPENIFIRVHQSYIINKNQIKEYVKGDGGSVVMSNNEEIYVSKRRKYQFLAALNHF